MRLLDRLEEVGVVIGWWAGGSGCGVKSGRFWNGGNRCGCVKADLYLPRSFVIEGFSAGSHTGHELSKY